MCFTDFNKSEQSPHGRYFGKQIVTPDLDTPLRVQSHPNSEAILPDSFSSFSPHISSGKGAALWLVVAFLLSAERLFLMVSNRLGRSVLRVHPERLKKNHSPAGLLATASSPDGCDIRLVSAPEILPDHSAWFCQAYQSVNFFQASSSVILKGLSNGARHDPDIQSRRIHFSLGEPDDAHQSDSDHWTFPHRFGVFFRGPKSNVSKTCRPKSVNFRGGPICGKAT